MPHKIHKNFIIGLLLICFSCSTNDNEKEDNQNPSTFNLLNVPDNSNDITLLPTFNWDTASDTEGNSISYDFILDTNMNPTTILSTAITNTNFELDIPLEVNTTYYWKVIAKDENSHSTQSAIFSFTTIAETPNTAPEGFNLISIEDNSLNSTLHPTFSWETAIDVDGDSILYDVYLDTNNQPNTKVAEDLQETSFTVANQLQNDTAYYWYVTAKDNRTNTTSEIYSFVTEVETTEADVPFSVVEISPIFPGCEDVSEKKDCFNEKMQQHIRDNFLYPQEAIDNNIEGRVFILLVISKTGEITNIRSRGPDELLINEALRIMNLLPKMTPGIQNGQNVNVPYSIPITFKL